MRAVVGDEIPPSGPAEEVVRLDRQRRTEVGVVRIGAVAVGAEVVEAQQVSLANGVADRPQRLTLLSGKRLLAYAVFVGDVFKALADPTRRAILDELLDRDGQTLFELCTRLIARHGLGSTRQAVSQHLNVLEDAGLITTRRQGRYKIHDLDPAPLRVIVERWLTSSRKDS